MLYEKIDLYEYFCVPRAGAKGGFLTSLATDVFFETGADHAYPAMIVVPGGAYFMCSRREADPVAFRFAAEGFQTFVLDYSVQTAYPAPLIEAAMAVAYVRENAPKYAVNAQKICAAGFSAGGHLTAMLATLFADEHIKTALGKKAALSRPDAVVLSYPVVTAQEGVTHVDTIRTISGGDKALAEKLSLETRVTAQSAPAFIWHTAEDACVPVENAFRLALAYKKAGVPFELHVFEEGYHGLSVMNGFTTNEFPEVTRCAQKWTALAAAWLRSKGFCAERK